MFFKPHPNPATQIFEALSTGSNYIECRLPFTFALEGRLKLAVLVNNMYYSNLVEVHTYPMTTIKAVSPSIIHGQQKLFPILLQSDQSGGEVDLPLKMRVRIDDDFYDAS